MFKDLGLSSWIFQVSLLVLGFISSYFDGTLVFFWTPRRKTMQNHQEITSKIKFWSRNVRNWTKTLTLVMSGPVQEDKYLLQTSGNLFIFVLSFLVFSGFWVKYLGLWSK